MTDLALEYLVQYGAWLLFVATFLSCLAVPMPASILMIAAGAFAAAGEFSILTVSGAALTGAILGDQLGYGLGRIGRNWMEHKAQYHPKYGAVLTKAKNLIHARGGIGVFLSRWLFSPLGPYVNLAAGASGYPWAAFVLWDALGEAIWVFLYVGIGYVFGENLDAAIEFASDFSGILAGIGVMILSGLWLVTAYRAHRIRLSNSA